MMWIVLTASKRSPEKVLADAHVEDHQATNRLKVYDTLAEAEQRKDYIEQRWPHFKVFVINLYSDQNP